MADHCIRCGAPALMGYRGRRAIDGPLCTRCIRARILADLPRPFVAADLHGERPPAVIDLRETQPSTLLSAEAPDDFYDSDSLTEPQPVPVGHQARANRPLRAQT